MSERFRQRATVRIRESEWMGRGAVVLRSWNILIEDSTRAGVRTAAQTLEHEIRSGIRSSEDIEVQLYGEVAEVVDRSSPPHPIRLFKGTFSGKDRWLGYAVIAADSPESAADALRRSLAVDPSQATLTVEEMDPEEYKSGAVWFLSRTRWVRRKESEECRHDDSCEIGDRDGK